MFSLCLSHLSITFFQFPFLSRFQCPRGSDKKLFQNYRFQSFISVCQGQPLFPIICPHQFLYLILLCGCVSNTPLSLPKCSVLVLFDLFGLHTLPHVVAILFSLAHVCLPTYRKWLGFCPCNGSFFLREVDRIENMLCRSLENESTDCGLCDCGLCPYTLQCTPLKFSPPNFLRGQIKGVNFTPLIKGVKPHPIIKGVWVDRGAHRLCFAQGLSPQCHS